MSLQAGHIVSLAIYALAVLWLGWWAQKRISGTEGYFVGGRKIPGWAVGISMLGTAISSITFLALPGAAYDGNWSRLVPGMMLPVAALIAVYFFVVFYRRTGFVSAYQYFENRFGPWGRSYTSAVWSLISIFRMGTILYLISVAIQSFTGWHILNVMFLTGALVTAYTIMGGLEAVIWTDVVQTIVLLAGGLVTVVIVFAGVPGGTAEVISAAAAAGKFDLAVTWDFDLTRDTVWVLALHGLVNNIQEFATDQTKIQRYAAARSDKDAVFATWIVGLGCIPVWALFMLVGSVLWVYYGHFPGLLPDGTAADKVYPYFIMTQMHPLLGGLVISAVLAAAMSSIDSSMNGTATVLTADFYRRHFVTNRDDAHYLRIARYITAGLGLVMIVVAYALYGLGEESILDTMMFVVAILAGGLAGFFLAGFLSTRVNERGAAIGLVVGVLVIFWCMASTQGWIEGSWSYPGHEFIINAVGNAAVFVSAYLASLLFGKPKDKETRGMTWWTRDETTDAVSDSHES